LDPTALDASKRRLGQWQDTLADFEQRSKQAVPAAQPEQTELLRHTVQQGETLIGVARQYNVRVSDIKAWNGLAESTLTPGQKLNVYLEKAAPAPEAAPAPDAQTEALEAISPEAEAAPEVLQSETPPAKSEENKKEEKEAAKEREKEKESKKAEEKKLEEKKAAEKKAEEAKKEKESKSQSEKEAVETPAPTPPPASEAPASMEPSAATSTADEAATPPAEPAAPASPLVPAETPATPETTPTAEPAPAPDASTEARAPAPLKDGKYHIWQEGDNLDAIAAQYKVSVEELKEWNLLDVAPPTNGMDLIVVAPPGSDKPKAAADSSPGKPTGTHTVKTGETLHRIAIQYGTSKDALVKLNNLERADLIWVGQKLKVPAKP